MKKSKIFNLSAISIIACDCLQAVICIFVDLFLISKILRNPGLTISQNIMWIGAFYAIYYSVLTLFYTWTGFVLRKINKSIFVSIGSIILTLLIVLINILQDRIFDFIPLLAVIYGIGFGLFSGGYNNLTAETISSKHQVKFFAVKRIVFQVVYIIFPITLGIVADLNFFIVALILVAVCIALVIFSFLIRPKKTYNQSFHVIKFVCYLKEHKKETKPLTYVYVSNFFRGASYDSFTTLLTIFVMITFASNTSLGMFQSIFTACSLVTMFFYLKFYRKKRALYFILPTIISVTLCAIALIAYRCSVTIIIFYAVYTILNVIIMSISDSRRAGVVRVLSLHSHILENNALAEFGLGTGRWLSSIVIMLAGILAGVFGGNYELFLKITLGWVCLMYIFYGIFIILLEKSLIKQDEEFVRAHSQEIIEKTED